MFLSGLCCTKCNCFPITTLSLFAMTMFQCAFRGVSIRMLIQMFSINSQCKVNYFKFKVVLFYPCGSNCVWFCFQLENASIDELVDIEGEVIQGTIDEIDAEIQEMEEEIKQSGGKDPERVAAMKERIKDLTNYLKQYEDLWSTFEEQMKRLGIDLKDVQNLMERLQRDPLLSKKRIKHKGGVEPVVRLRKIGFHCYVE